MPPPDSPPAALKSRRRWLRPSLRGLMVLILLVGGGLGSYIHEVDVQHRAVAAIERTGGSVRYHWQRAQDHWIDLNGQPPVPAWLIRWLGPDFFGRVIEVNLGPAATDAELAQVLGCRHLVAFNDRGSAITDAQAVHLGRLPNLERVVFSNTSRVSAAILAGFAGSRQLTILSLGALSGSARDADVAALAGSTGLMSLTLPGDQLTDAGLAHLAGLIDLLVLGLSSPAITDAGLAHLRGLTALQTLSLDTPAVTPAGVGSFTAAKDLTTLILPADTAPAVMAAYRQTYPAASFQLTARLSGP